MAGSGGSRGVVVGVAIGTTSTKAVAYDTRGRQIATHSVAPPKRH